MGIFFARRALERKCLGHAGAGTAKTATRATDGSRRHPPRTAARATQQRQELEPQFGENPKPLTRREEAPFSVLEKPCRAL